MRNGRRGPGRAPSARQTARRAGLARMRAAGGGGPPASGVAAALPDGGAAPGGRRSGVVMAAAPPPGRELCPHCHRPFKRLRAHLPHCKAAPSPAAGGGPGPRAGPGLGLAAATGSGSSAGPAAESRPRAVPAGKRSEQASSSSMGQPGAALREAAAGRAEPAAAAEQGGGASGSGGRRVQREVEPAVQDVAKALDLLPEEVKDLPQTLSNGVEIVIEKHRARVIREKSGARSGSTSAGSRSPPKSPLEGPHPGGAADQAGTAQPDPQKGVAAPETVNVETRILGAVVDASVSSKGEKSSSLKAAKLPTLCHPPEAGCGSNPSDLVQQEAIGKAGTEEKQMYLEAGEGYKAPLYALHTKNLHLPVTEDFRGHKEETSKHYLTSTQKLRESEKQMAAVSKPILNARTDTELAQPQLSLHTSQSQPICFSLASGRRTTAGAMALEWFPDLHPNYQGLSVFPGKPFREDMGITMRTPKGRLSEGQQGNVRNKPLLPVSTVPCEWERRGGKC